MLNSVAKIHVIGLCGRAGSGKSTAAQYLVAAHGARILKFATPMKAMLGTIGLTYDEIEGDLKESPCEVLCGHTPRQAMQWLGTEWGRDRIGPDLWVRIWRAQVRQMGPGLIVADDLRYANEVLAVRALGGKVIKLSRAAAGSATGSEHLSERLDFLADSLIPNEGTREELGRDLDEILKVWGLI
jgi:hypothetical protein